MEAGGRIGLAAAVWLTDCTTVWTASAVSTASWRSVGETCLSSAPLPPVTFCFLWSGAWLNGVFLLSKSCFVLLIYNAEHLQTRYPGKLQGRSVCHLTSATTPLPSLKAMDMLERSVCCTMHIFFPPFSLGTICGLLRQTDKFCSLSLKFHLLSF